MFDNNAIRNLKICIRVCMSTFKYKNMLQKFKTRFPNCVLNKCKRNNDKLYFI